MSIKDILKRSLMVSGWAIIVLFCLSCQSRREKATELERDLNVALASEREIGSHLQRDRLIHELRSHQFDVLIIGGGATGAGAALDSASRGLKTALIEAGDFSSGTSSRSTKLVHGGVRYLENAVKRLDRREYELVRDALHERKHFLQNAPHLTEPLPIVTPVYGWFAALYYWIGLKFYDLVSADASLGASIFISASEALRRFPNLKKSGLKGAVVFHDGQFDDARMNVALILSALREGATALNYVMAEGLLKEDDRIVGVMVHDAGLNASWPVQAKVVINATGVFADAVRQMDDPHAPRIMVPSVGSHIILPERFAPRGNGLIIPKTKDDRVLFLLPWLGKAIAGTTDLPHDVTALPKASHEEVSYILEHLKNYLDIPITKSDVIATFSGLRPLAKLEVSEHSTADMSRDYLIEVTRSNLITVVGGKWTTYRKMGEDVIDTAVRVGSLSPQSGSVTKSLKLVGARFFNELLAEEMMAYEALEPDIARHLAFSYGDRVDAVIDVDNKTRRKRLISGFPFIEAEVIYAVRDEYALHATDVIARRMRLAFLHNQAARSALPRVIELMAEELDWDEEKKSEEMEMAIKFLDTMVTSG